jgi:hypothetical protein
MSNAMKRAKTYIVGAALAASVFLFGVMSAFADSYSVNVVAYTQNENFYGIDTAGDFAVNVSNSLVSASSSCGGVLGASQCFATYYVGQEDPVFTTSAPSLAWDNGSSCASGTLSGVCNKGHQLLGGYLDDTRGIWTGTDPLTDYLTGGTFDGGFMNARGDAVFINGATDTLMSVVDTPNLPAFNFFDAKLQVSNPAPVPEPASVWLVGMGLMVSCMVSVKRRRNFKVRSRKKSGW